MSNLIEVTVQIPEDRLSELYEAVADIINRPKRNTSHIKAPQPWAKGDKVLATVVFAKLSQNAQKVVRYLANRPDQNILGAEIATALGLSKGQQAIAGVLGPVGIHCKKVNRQMPYTTHYPSGATAAFYCMSQEVAELFK